MGKMEAAEQVEPPTPLPSSPAQTGVLVTLRELSAERQRDWIERLFSRLAALYGAAFGRQWDGTNLADVKATWADKLGGFTASQIASALQACDDRQYPPNLPEFIGMCRDAARRDSRPATLPAPTPTAEEVARRIDQAVAERKPKDGYDFLHWAKCLRTCYLSGERLLPMQIVMASAALGEVWSNRQCEKVAA